ncbi:MAG: Ig-like domain-containing protein, partial [Pseudomonadota bacterium]|nr:Ig-like domain-containing protein [Pseudomonadota bacterium]
MAASGEALNNLAEGATALLSVYGLINAIQTHSPLAELQNGMTLVTAATGTAKDPFIGGVNSALSIAGNIVGFENALKHGTLADQVTSGIGLAYSVGEVIAKEELKVSLEQATSNTAIGAALPVLPYLAAIDQAINGNWKGAAIDAASAFVAAEIGAEAGAQIGEAAGPIGAVVGAFVGFVLGGLTQGTPQTPWGTGLVGWGAAPGSVAFTVVNDHAGGGAFVTQTLTSAVNSIQSMVDAFNKANPNTPIGLVANRFSSLALGSHFDYSTGSASTYHVNTLDSATGIDPYPTLQFDVRTGRSYGVDINDPAYAENFNQFYAQNAFSRGVIAPMWEVLTAQEQSQKGLTNAGLTEEERANNLGELAKPIAAGATTESFNPIGLDFGGHLATTSLADSTVQFDVDGANSLESELLGTAAPRYVKNTSWLNMTDGFLVLDKNMNGAIDDGSEMFSNSNVDQQARGVSSLQVFDADGNGVIDANDPVFSQLKVWRDLNGNGQVDPGEASSLQSLGITSINYALGTFTMNGQQQQMSTLNLTASTVGTTYKPVDGGIQLTNTNGQTSILVTQVHDLSSIEPGADEISTQENVPVTVLAHGDASKGTSGLLDNDKVSNAPNALLNITAAANAVHGSVNFDANTQSVTFTPDAGYSGNAAGFDYTVDGGVYGSKQVHVEVDVAKVDQGPTIVGSQNTQRGYYGYQIVGGRGQSDDPYQFAKAYKPGVWYGSPTEFSADVYQGTPIGYDTLPLEGDATATDPDVPLPSLTWSVVSQPHHAQVSVDNNGHWVVTNALDLGTKDSFQLQVADPNGHTAQITVTVQLPSPPPPPPIQTGQPIILDLNGSGFHFESIDQSNAFVTNGQDGLAHKTGWVGGGNGILAMDIYHDGMIHDSSQISFKQYAPDARTDLEGLRGLDTNHDGVISKLDASWSELGVWVDANGDGQSQAGEFKTLDQLGITSIGLDSDGQFSVDNGVTVHGHSTFTRADGSVGQTADVTLPVSSQVLQTNADGSTSVVQQSGTAVPATIVVGDANSAIVGNAGNNVVQAGNGDNVIITNAGNDMIYAGNGNN